MATIPSDEINPFRAPAAAIGQPTLTGAGSDAELIRRTYLNHEASIKALGSLNYLGAFGCAVGLVFCVLAALGVFNLQGANANPEVNPRLMMAGGAALLLVGTIIYGGMGYGLRHLQPWARWVTIVLIGLSLLVQVGQIVMLVAMNPALIGGALIGGIIGALIPGYILYLMASSKGSMVFSREYREIIRLTPHIKYKMSFLVKFLVGLLLFVLLIGLVGGIMSAVGSR